MNISSRRAFNLVGNMILAKKRRNTGFGDKSGFNDQAILPPDRPSEKILGIKLPPDLFETIKSSGFAKLRLISKEGAFSIDVILKKTDTCLMLVPKNMPMINVVMGLDDFESNFEERTRIQLHDPEGRSLLLDIVQMKKAVFETPLWGSKKEYTS